MDFEKANKTNRYSRSRQWLESEASWNWHLKVSSAQSWILCSVWPWQNEKVRKRILGFAYKTSFHISCNFCITDMATKELSFYEWKSRRGDSSENRDEERRWAKDILFDDVDVTRGGIELQKFYKVVPTAKSCSTSSTFRILRKLRYKSLGFLRNNPFNACTLERIISLKLQPKLQTNVRCGQGLVIRKDTWMSS